MKTRVLTAVDVKRLIEKRGLDRLVDDLLDHTERSFRAFEAERYDVPIRAGFNYTHPIVGLVEFMPVHAFDVSVTQKAVGYHPCNPAAHGLPTILSSVSVYDVRTGHLEALLDGVLLTALRTGVASAVAARAFADPASQTLGLIGCGAQGVAQVHALSRVLKPTQILAHDTDPAVRASYVGRLASVGIHIPVRFVSCDEILREADVLTTATSVDAGVGSVFADGAHKAHLHINAVGSDFPGKTECPLSLLERAVVIPDFRAQAMLEGESQRLDPDGLGPDLLEALRHDQDWAQRLTVFDSTGWAYEDHITAGFLLREARELGIGQDLAIESVPSDPYNPFA